MEATNPGPEQHLQTLGFAPGWATTDWNEPISQLTACFLCPATSPSTFQANFSPSTCTKCDGSLMIQRRLCGPGDS
jgi:hypothetical protein